MAKQFIENVEKMLREEFPQFSIVAVPDPHGRNIVILEGEVDTWQSVIDIGHAAAKVDGVRNVVSDLSVKGLEIPRKDYSPYIAQGKEIGVIDEADVVIVGLGIVGCATARALSKYNLKVIALDMGDDVSTAASKANNGGVHMAGMVKPGTLKAELSVRGNQMYDQLAEELGFEFIRTGNMVYTDDIQYIQPLVDMFVTAVKNKDKKPAIIDGEAILDIAPTIKTVVGVDPVAAVWMPSQAKVHPYKVCVAMAENAAVNGVKFMFNCTVGDILTENGKVTEVITSKGIIKTKYVVNAAGLYGDEIAAMAGDRCFTMHNRKGTIVIIDKNKEPIDRHHVLQKYNPAAYAQKNVESKGGGIDVTPSGNILIGPSATEVPDKEDTSTTADGLAYTMSRNDDPEVSEADIIRLFAGARPADMKEDFIVEMSEVTDGMIIAGAIQSPGIGSAPAVAERIEQIIEKDLESKGMKLEPDPNFNPIRKREIEFASLSREEQDKLISERPEYGRVVCRCETITEGEILDAIHSPIVPTSIDAIKRRVRAGMGRCQGGFCQPRVLEILARELGKEWVDINLKGEGTNILKQKNR